MKSRIVAIGCIATWLSGASAASAALTSSEFTYQGQLQVDGVPVTDTCDFVFTLWSDASSVLAQDQVGPTLTFDGDALAGNPDPIAVVNGLFAVGLDFGAVVYDGNDRFLDVAVICPAGSGAPVSMVPRELLTATPYATQTRGIFVDEPGNVGLGTTTPDAPFHLRTFGRFRGNHIAYFESISGPSSDGIAIQLSPRNTNRDNNFITFYNGSQRVTGRIEGFDFENGDWISPPPIPNPNLRFDPGISYNPDWLSLGTLPTATFAAGSLPTVTFDPGRLPTAFLNRGSLPTATFNGGSLPSLAFNGGSLPSATFSRGSLPTATFSRGSLPSFSTNTTVVLGVRVVTGFNFSTGSLPGLNFSGGSLPSLTFNRGSLPRVTFTRGSLPSLTFSGGSLPSLTFSGGAVPSLTFSGGSLPSLTFSGGSLPEILKSPLIFETPSLSFDLPTLADLEALFCWGLENDVSDFITMDPVSLAISRLKETALQKCKDEGVTYGSKGADYAEWLPKLNPEDRFQFAQVVGVHAGKVSLDTQGAEQIMVVSRAPVVVGNVPPADETDQFVTVGFMGQLPVVVRGNVNAGDFIIPSGLADGTAVAVSPENLQLAHLGQTIGRAWSESDNDVYSLITVVIGLKGDEAGIILTRQRDRMDRQAREQRVLSAKNAQLTADVVGVREQLAAMMETMQELQDTVRGQAACATTVANVNQ